MITLPYPPSVNHLYATVRGRRVLSKEGRQYKATTAALAYAAGVRPLAGDVTLIVHLYRPQKSGDLDNFLKSLQDALKGVAWIDDKQVKRIEAERFEDKLNPRAEILVKEIGKAVTK